MSMKKTDKAVYLQQALATAKGLKGALHAVHDYEHDHYDHFKWYPDIPITFVVNGTEYTLMFNADLWAAMDSLADEEIKHYENCLE